jgi:hypothetical protein
MWQFLLAMQSMFAWHAQLLIGLMLGLVLAEAHK